MGAAGPLELAAEGLSAGSAYGQTLAALAHLPSVLLSQRGMPLSLRAEGCVPFTFVSVWMSPRCPRPGRCLSTVGFGAQGPGS